MFISCKHSLFDMYREFEVRQFHLLSMVILAFCCQKGLAQLVLLQGECACPGQETVYECTTTGGGSTVWQGRFFDCPNSAISLRHSQFSDIESVVGICNNGLIQAHGVSVSNDSFTSRINITVTKNMIGEIIQCVHDDGRQETVVGEKNLMNNITSESLKLSGTIHASRDGANKVAFSWNPLAITSYCQSLSIQYNIESNCGVCPRTANYTIVTCSEIAIDRTKCQFSVYASAVCGNDTVGEVLSTSLVLNVPYAPSVHAIPHYSYQSKKLARIHTTFNKMSPTNISDEVDGSPVSYTIQYLDIVTESTCSSTVIPASSCEDRVCTHEFDVSASSCPPSAIIDVKVFGTNLLGNGQISTSKIIGSVNSRVHVIFDIDLLTVYCKFLNSEDTSAKSCIIEYGLTESCDNLSYIRQSNISTDLIVTLDLLVHPGFHEKMMHCFTVTASTATYTLKVIGKFNTSCDPGELSDGTSPPDSSMCGGSPFTLGIKNGIVCYSSNRIGSTAIYSCLSCGLYDIKGPHVRSCLADGRWNGTIPKCTCGGDFTLISTVMTTLFAFCTLIFATITCIVIAMLIKAKRRNHKILKELGKAVIYDEIVMNSPSSSPVVDIEKNVAYEQAVKVAN